MRRLRRVREVLAQPQTWVRVHAALCILWAVLMAPSVLWWKDSIAWVIVMSCYANFAGSMASLQAARADRNSGDVQDLERVERKIDALRNMVKR